MPQKETAAKERRKYFRICYAPEEPAKLRIGRCVFSVLDISKGGLCFHNHKNARFGHSVDGLVTLTNGTSFSIRGRILRKREAYISIEFRNLIPFTPMLEERQLCARAESA
jgi:hypothetical protein